MKCVAVKLDIIAILYLCPIRLFLFTDINISSLIYKPVKGCLGHYRQLTYNILFLV